MRRTSFILAGAVALCLAITSAGATLGEEAETPTLATGVFRIAEGAEAGQTEAGQRWNERDVSTWGWLESSDPRIDGTLGLITDGEASPEDDGPGFVWGSAMLETEAGMWVGPMAGWLDADRLTIPVWMVGQGAHEGLVAFMDITGSREAAEAGFAVEAMIHEGTAPQAMTTTERPEPIGVVGRMAVDGIDEPGEILEVDGVEQLRDRVVLGSMEATDPRLSGTVRATVNEDGFRSPETPGRASLSWGRMGIENEGGAWHLEWSGGAGPTGGNVLIASGVGVDGYEGWSARLWLTARSGMAGMLDIRGALVEGELPSLAEPGLVE